MKYELELFDGMINGELSPLVHCRSEAELTEILQANYKEPHAIVTLTLKKSRNKFKVLDKTVIHSLHPFANELINFRQELFEPISLKELPPEIKAVIDIKQEDVLHIAISRRLNTSLLVIKEKTQWKRITCKELKYYYYNHLLRTEELRLKDHIRKTVFEINSSHELEHYIHKLQQAFVNLCFQLLKVFSLKQQNDIYKPATRFDDIEIFYRLFITLEELLKFFEKNYFGYMDKTIQVPCRSELAKTYKINEKLELVKNALIESELDAALLKIIYVPFLKLSAVNYEEGMSYKELIYFITYLNAFYEEITEGNQKITEAQIREILYRVNYNSLELKNYKTGIVKESLSMVEDIQDKIDYLYHCLKILYQRTCKVNIAFNADLPSLKDQLTTWLEEEITYLNKRFQCTTKIQSANLFTEPDKIKIQSGLTVAQLALVFKLQVDAGIIAHKSQLEIFKHIAENYQTSKVQDISVDSIKNKYYNVDTSTIEVIKDKAIQVLNLLKTLSWAFPISLF